VSGLPLSAAERLDRLRLIRTDNVGPITFVQLLRRFGSAGAALDALPQLSRKGGMVRPLKPCDRATAERELRR
jgi:DNA processing protein